MGRRHHDILIHIPRLHFCIPKGQTHTKGEGRKRRKKKRKTETDSLTLPLLFLNMWVSSSSDSSSSKTIFHTVFSQKGERNKNKGGDHNIPRSFPELRRRKMTQLTAAHFLPPEIQLSHNVSFPKNDFILIGKNKSKFFIWTMICFAKMTFFKWKVRKTPRYE